MAMRLLARLRMPTQALRSLPAVRALATGFHHAARVQQPLAPAAPRAWPSASRVTWGGAQRQLHASPVAAASSEGPITSELITRMRSKIATALETELVEVQDMQGDGRHVRGRAAVCGWGARGRWRPFWAWSRPAQLLISALLRPQVEIVVISKLFDGKSAVNRQRMVYKVRGRAVGNSALVPIVMGGRVRVPVAGALLGACMPQQSPTATSASASSNHASRPWPFLPAPLPRRPSGRSCRTPCTLWTPW